MHDVRAQREPANRYATGLILRIKGDCIVGNVTYDDYGYFAYIGVNSSYQHHSLILDTNVVIAMEKFYYRPHKMLPLHRQAMADFLINIIGADPVPGFGIQEACWDYSKSRVNSKQMEKLERAINDIYTWDKDIILRHSRSSGIKYDEVITRSAINKTESHSQDFDSNPLLLGSYATLLKIYLLNRKKSTVPGMKLFKELVEFMDKTLGLIHSLELQLAVDYFLASSSKSEYVQKLLKFSSKDALHAIWGASWDIFFLRALQNSFYDKGHGLVNPKLVTADKALAQLADYITLSAVIDDGEVRIPVLIQDARGLSNSEYDIELEKISRELYFTVKQRTPIQDFNEFTNNVSKVIKDLEKEIVNKA